MVIRNEMGKTTRDETKVWRNIRIVQIIAPRAIRRNVLVERFEEDGAGLAPFLEQTHPLAPTV